ncbi:hypothetical protein [Bacteroides oleiciplenus]|uniref:Uncharacterized protein n=1 Tax=Bacteroides oleiciplenus TaxID=626931 RepID=A0A3E5BKX4_9BACE|nr:hypothetical protein [Bacteroides oleiciplenus]RGN38260.1 hypothetical protein DXB65_05320 [Bacteroides oleiciplenus]
MIELIEILRREKENTNRIYLYCEADNWFAYEQSAYRLCQLSDNCLIQAVVSQKYAALLIRAGLCDEQVGEQTYGLLPFVRKFAIHKEEDCIEIILPGQGATLFSLWKENELKEKKNREIHTERS